MRSTAKTTWLMLTLSLPTRRASQRVEVWRKLKRCGTLALPGAGHVLPFSSANYERLQWLANTIRAYKGTASVLEVSRIDNLSDERIAQLFRDARTRDYQALIAEAQKPHTSNALARKLVTLKRRLGEIVEIDYFDAPARKRAETVITRLAEYPAKAQPVATPVKREYVNRKWITRPRPGIDRVASAWLITRFVDPKATFVFGNAPQDRPDAVPFDMFSDAGFGHQGDRCTFEMLAASFKIEDPAVQSIAEIVHDADLADGKFGRTEGIGIEHVLIGWERQGIPDSELLRKGIDIIGALYGGLAKSRRIRKTRT